LHIGGEEMGSIFGTTADIKTMSKWKNIEISTSNKNET
jgi:hypothetical protein